MRTKLGISPENIILYGQSIGTVPTVDLASRFEVGPRLIHDVFTQNVLNRLGRWSFIARWCPACGSPSLRPRGHGSLTHSLGNIPVRALSANLMRNHWSLPFSFFQHWQDASSVLSCLSNTWHRRRGTHNFWFILVDDAEMLQSQDYFSAIYFSEKSLKEWWLLSMWTQKTSPFTPTMQCSDYQSAN